MLSQLIDEPYFDRNIIPDSSWRSLDRVDNCELRTVLYFWTNNYFVNFSFKNELVDSTEKLFKIVEDNLLEVEKILLDHLVVCNEARCSQYGHPDPDHNQSLFYGFTENFDPNRSLREKCLFIGINDYPANRNVAKLFLYAINEEILEEKIFLYAK